MKTRQYFFVNGICNDAETAIEYAKYISNLTSQITENHEPINVITINNASNGRISDVTEATVNKYGYITTPAYLIYDTLGYYNKKFPEKEILIIAHSQGAILTKHALQMSSKKVQDKVTVVAIGPASFVSKDCCKKARNYICKRDLVGYIINAFDLKYEKKYGKIKEVYHNHKKVIELKSRPIPNKNLPKLKYNKKADILDEISKKIYELFGFNLTSFSSHRLERLMYRSILLKELKKFIRSKDSKKTSSKKNEQAKDHSIAFVRKVIFLICTLSLLFAILLFIHITEDYFTFSKAV